ncbi:quinone-dependent dihydroorotate dehydrogenase [Pelagibius litoralis]|uniref:quinone-dependent dihydroorotate dehydrogenase n=1 Tax=Pelagibius litoralis TaxID=374515 RepID=UPI001F0EF86E|nr:quinone-dependent dihydroorotate dehydrogenase [Pelagibius litoralis]
MFDHLIGPALRLLDPETAHGVTLKALGMGLGPRAEAPEDPILAIRLWGRDFANPLGLSAGFDKDAAVMAPMLRLGLGFVEVGSITPRPQPGNPKPRIFRLPEDGAVINRLGFNNGGLAQAQARLTAFREHQAAGGLPSGNRGLVGINLGKNKETEDAAADYEKGAAALGPLADYLVVNVSSPNTPGLRALQGRAELEALLGRVMDALPAPAPPLLLKIAPDLTEEDKQDIAAVCLAQGVSGIIATNTTIQRPASLKAAARDEAGGLSGRPLFAPSTAVLADLYRLTEGRLPLIGVGGITSGADAYRKIRAGASLVQLYTALIYRGPALVWRIKRELAGLLREDGFETLAAAVGADHRYGG